MANNTLHFLVEWTWLGTAAIILILLLRLPLRRYFGPTLAYFSWAILPLSLLASLLPHASTTVTGAGILQPAAELSAITMPAMPAASGQMPFWCLLTWASGAALMLIWFAAQHRYFLKRLGPLSVAGPIYQAQSMQIGPALLGVWRTRIVVPQDFFERYTAQEQALIIAHEQMHSQRRDPFCNLLYALLQCLFWFNPLLHFAAHRYRLDQELACDADVIARHQSSPRHYAEALLKTLSSPSSTALACHLQSPQTLKERIMRLQQTRPTLARRLVAYALLGSVTSLCAYAAWAATPATAGETLTSKGAESSKTKTYSLATSILIGTEKYTPRIVTAAGEPAHIAINAAGKQWDIKVLMTPNPKPSKVETVMIAMQISKDGQLVEQPKLLVELNQAGRMQKETPDHQDDFDITLTASLAGK